MNGLPKKDIKLFLRNFKEIVTAQWVTELQKDSPNLAVSAHWNNMIVAIEEMIKMQDNETTA